MRKLVAQNTADCVVLGLNAFSNLEPENARGSSLWTLVGAVILRWPGS